jgi:phosphatidylserine decarboxylase
MTIFQRSPIHREGLPIVAIFIVAAVILWLIWTPLGLVGMVLTLWCIWFFRDPERVTPDLPGAIISPADGQLLPIVEAPPPEELGMGSVPRQRISIFMNIFNVHVNRIPADGVILETHYRPGRFFNASFDKASIHNERLSVRMKMESGEELAFVQIAGLVARRIRSDLSPGDQVRAGERFGLIRFGSRVDVYLPDGLGPSVMTGQTMTAGETVIAVGDGQSVSVEIDRSSVEN